MLSLDTLTIQLQLQDSCTYNKYVVSRRIIHKSSLLPSSGHADVKALLSDYCGWRCAYTPGNPAPGTWMKPTFQPFLHNICQPSFDCAPYMDHDSSSNRHAKKKNFVQGAVQVAQPKNVLQGRVNHRASRRRRRRRQSIYIIFILSKRTFSGNALTPSFFFSCDSCVYICDSRAPISRWNTIVFSPPPPLPASPSHFQSYTLWYKPIHSSSVTGHRRTHQRTFGSNDQQLPGRPGPFHVRGRRR